MAIDFRKTNPLSVPTASETPSFGKETYAQISKVGQSLEKITGMMNKHQVEVDNTNFQYNAKNNFRLAATQKLGELKDGQKGGKMEDGRSMSDHFLEWSKDFKDIYVENAPTDESRNQFNLNVDSLSTGYMTKIMPYQGEQAVKQTLVDQDVNVNNAAKAVQSLNPDDVRNQSEDFIIGNGNDLLEMAGKAIPLSMIDGLEQKYNSTVAVSAMENYVANQRPDLMLEALQGFAHTEDGKKLLAEKGIDPDKFMHAGEATILEASLTPAQKAKYTKLAVSMVESRNQYDKSTTLNRVQNFINVQKLGTLTSLESQGEYEALENKLNGVDLKGDPLFTPVQKANSLLRMTGAMINKEVTDALHGLSASQMSQSATIIKAVTTQKLDELKERHKDDPKMMEYLNSPTLVDSVSQQFYAEQQRVQKEIMRQRTADSADYLINGAQDKEVARLHHEFLSSVSNGMPNPIALRETIEALKTKASNLGIPVSAQTMLPEETMKILAQRAIDIRDKVSTNGEVYKEYLQSLKDGIPENEWLDFKNKMKDNGMKESDFYTIDNIPSEISSHYQKLYNPTLVKSMGELAKSYKVGGEGLEQYVRKQITEQQGFFAGMFGADPNTGGSIWSSGFLGQNNPLGRALLGPTGDLKRNEMYARLVDMATKSHMYRVMYEGADPEDFSKLQQEFETLFPVISGDAGDVIMFGEHSATDRSVMEKFLDYEHKPSDYNMNFISDPAMIKKFASLGITSEQDKMNYMNENYNVKFYSVSEGSIGAYLENKDDGEKIPLIVNDDKGNVVPMEISKANVDSHFQRKLRRDRAHEQLPEDIKRTKEELYKEPKEKASSLVKRGPQAITSNAHDLMDKFAEIYDQMNLNYGEMKAGDIVGIEQEVANELNAEVPDGHPIGNGMTGPKDTMKASPELVEAVKAKFRLKLAQKLGQSPESVSDSINLGINVGFNPSKKFKRKNKMSKSGPYLILMTGKDNRPLQLSHSDNAFNEMFSSAQRNYYADKNLLKAMAYAESNLGANRFDSGDDLSSGLMHIRHDRLGLIQDFKNSSHGLSIALKSASPDIWKRVQTMDKDSLAYDDEASIAMASIFTTKVVQKKVQELFPDLKNEDKLVMMAVLYNAGPNQKSIIRNKKGEVVKNKDGTPMTNKDFYMLKFNDSKSTSHSSRVRSKLRDIYSKKRKGRSPQDIETSGTKIKDSDVFSQDAIDVINSKPEGYFEMGDLPASEMHSEELQEVIDEINDSYHVRTVEGLTDDQLKLFDEDPAFYESAETMGIRTPQSKSPLDFVSDPEEGDLDELQKTDPEIRNARDVAKMRYRDKEFDRKWEGKGAKKNRKKKGKK